MTTNQVATQTHTVDPLTGKALILATRKFAAESRLRSWWAVLSTLGLTGAALTGTLLPWPMPLRIACSLLSGLLVVRTFVLYHDHQHHSLLAGSKVAEAIMRIIGLLILAPSSVWKSSHNHHHNHNSKLQGSHIGSFPIMTRERYEAASSKERIAYHFQRHPLTIFSGYLTAFAAAMCLLPFIHKPIRHMDGLFALLLHGAVGVALFLFGGWAALTLTLLVPCAIGGGLGCYLFYAQHNFPAVKHTEKSGWTYDGAALESSSFLDVPAWMHWFTANIGYHHVHHLNAKIPFYRLPEAMQAMPELQQPRTTSLHPVEVMRCLRLKVWDVEKGRMTPV